MTSIVRQAMTSCNFPEPSKNKGLKRNDKTNIYLRNKTAKCEITVNEKYDTLAHAKKSSVEVI